MKISTADSRRGIWPNPPLLGAESEPIELTEIAESWQKRLLRERIREFFVNPVITCSLGLVVGLGGGLLSASVIAQKAEDRERQKANVIYQVVGRACIDHVLSLNKRPGPRPGPDAVNVAENCNRIAERAIERLTWGSEGKEAKGGAYVKTGKDKWAFTY